MTDQTQPPRALSFGSAAAQYDQLRPPYPQAALRWALGDQPLTVVDLGAGTGILSRTLQPLGHDVIPVEPDPAMRDQLAARSPDLRPLSGYAEAMPLPDASVDAVVAGQAYHWFDPEPTHAEVARVLRPGGVFAIMWNDRDDSVPWVAALSEVSEDDTAGRSAREPDHGPSSFGPGFGPVERVIFTHAVEHTPGSLVGLIATRSYYLTSTPQRRSELERRVRHLCATHPDLAGRDSFPLPYWTRAYRATRSGV